jgi:hypothetical protein
MNGHDRIEMIASPIQKRYVCKICRETLTSERISSEVPKMYRDYPEALLFLDFEIQPVILPDRKLLLEYPRRGLGG